MNKAVLRWQGGIAFSATAESGHSLTLDGAIENGGKNSGLRPMEAVLIGAAACSAVDVAHILAKSRQILTDFRVEVSAKRADSDPKVFTEINLRFVARGEVAEKPLARAVELGVGKYCSALSMLEKTAKINHSCAIES